MSVDAMDVVTEWVKSTSVASLVTWGGRTHIYQGAPTGAPMPAVILHDIGTTRDASSDTGEKYQRVSFSVRTDAKAKGKQIKSVLIDEIEAFARLGAVTTAIGRVKTGEVIVENFRFDTTSNLPEYLIDARFVVTNL